MKELKEVYIHIKMTEKEKQALKINAERRGMSISQYVRSQCIYK